MKGEPIPDLQVRINPSGESHPQGWLHTDTLQTDTNGDFIFSKTDFPFMEYRLIIEDIDWDKNKAIYASDTITVTFDSNDFSGGEGWSLGSASKEIQIQLKEYIDTHTEPYTLYTFYGRVTDQDGWPVPGVTIYTSPAYTPNIDEDITSFPAVTDETGRYQFTYDQAPATEHTLYARLSPSFSDPQYPWKTDSIVVNFGEIELIDGVFEETCYKDIAFGPKNMGLDEAEIDRRVHEAADFVGLDPALLERSPFELSGGQKRRVAVAGVMAMKPRILVLDEPAAGLDPEGRDDILSEVKEYHKKTGTTVLLVSHSMEDIAKYANRVLVMSNKKIAMYDTVEKVFARAPELLELGLSVPQVTKIFLKLREMGVDVPADVYTIPYAVKMILEAKRRREAGESLVLPREAKKEGGAAGC